MKELKLDFNEFIKNYVDKKLDDMKGKEVYGEDLASRLAMTDNPMTKDEDGYHQISLDKNKEFITKYWEEAGETYNYLENEVNPFREPDKFVMCMINKGVEDLVNKTNIVNKHWDKDWDKPIKFTPETIHTLKSELGIEINKNINIEQQQSLPKPHRPGMKM